MALYQNYGPGVEISPLLWCLGFHIKKEILKKLRVQNGKDYSFHIWHEALCTGPLPKYFKLQPCHGNWPYVVGLGFHIRDKEGNLSNYSCSKSSWLELSYMTYGII